MRDSSSTYTFAANDNGRNSSASLNSATVGSYLYNAFEQRAQKIAGAATTQFVYDRAGHLLEEANASGIVQKEYIWLDDLPVAMVDDTGSSPVLYFIHTDQLGTPQKITDGSASIVWDGVFDPFGNTVSLGGSLWGTAKWGSFSWGSLTNNLRFPGQYADVETGLDQNWNRDYDPTLGRYIKSDPVGLNGGINTYVYSLSNPLDNIDSDGLQIAVPVPGPPLVTPSNNSMWNQNMALGRWLTSQLGRAIRHSIKNCIDEDCEQEWEDARDFCDEVAARNGWGSGWSHQGRNYQQCVMGQVSERCGGNAVDHSKSPGKGVLSDGKRNIRKIE